ncbi:MAG: response regulator transcription factor [Spirosomataceae bacterium]
MPIRVVIYEDNQALRESLTMLINGTEGMALVGAFPNCREVEQQIATLTPQVVLMDIDMPVRNGLEGLRVIAKQFPDVNVMMLTVFETNEYIFEAICAGAVGYLLKKSSPADIISAIVDVQHGGAPMSAGIARKVLQFVPKTAPISASTSQTKATDEQALTSREIEVLTLLTKGYTYRMTAYELGVSVETIRTHIKRIYQKLHVHSNTEAVAQAIDKGLVRR